VWTIVGSANVIAAAALAATTPMRALTRASTVLAGAAMARSSRQFQGRVGGWVFAIGRMLKPLEPQGNLVIR